MLLKNSTGLYKQTKQIELSKVMFCLIIMMMIESLLHTHTRVTLISKFWEFQKSVGFLLEFWKMIFGKLVSDFL